MKSYGKCELVIDKYVKGKSSVLLFSLTNKTKMWLQPNTFMQTFRPLRHGLSNMFTSNIAEINEQNFNRILLFILQDTLKSSPPENKVMKKATFVGVSTTTLFYALCGCVGYAAFGNDAPGNFLTGFGFYEPFWLIDFANVCIAIHLIGAYQVQLQSPYIISLVRLTAYIIWYNSSCFSFFSSVQRPNFC